MLELQREVDKKRIGIKGRTKDGLPALPDLLSTELKFHME